MRLGDHRRPQVWWQPPPGPSWGPHEQGPDPGPALSLRSNGGPRGRVRPTPPAERRLHMAGTSRASSVCARYSPHGPPGPQLPLSPTKAPAQAPHEDRLRHMSRGTQTSRPGIWSLHLQNARSGRGSHRARQGQGGREAGRAPRGPLEGQQPPGPGGGRRGGGSKCRRRQGGPPRTPDPQPLRQEAEGWQDPGSLCRACRCSQRTEGVRRPGRFWGDCEGPGKTATGPEEGEAGARPAAALDPGVGCPGEARARTHMGGSWDDTRLCTFWKVAHSPWCRDHARTEHM